MRRAWKDTDGQARATFEIMHIQVYLHTHGSFYTCQCVCVCACVRACVRACVLALCDNWCGIAPPDVVGKLVGCVIQNRLQMFISELLPELQWGFSKGQLCTDHLFVVC